ncbi:MAG TPA: hypothetical protein VIP70_12160 [Nitrososphaeraceae archaeon]
MKSTSLLPFRLKRRINRTVYLGIISSSTCKRNCCITTTTPPPGALATLAPADSTLAMAAPESAAPIDSNRSDYKKWT